MVNQSHLCALLAGLIAWGLPAHGVGQQIRHCIKQLRANPQPPPAKVVRLGPTARERADLHTIQRAAVLWEQTQSRTPMVLIKPMSAACLRDLRHQRSIYVPSHELLLIRMTREEYALFEREAEELGRTRVLPPSFTGNANAAPAVSPGVLITSEGTHYLVMFEKSETVFMAGQSAKRSMSYVLVALPGTPQRGTVGVDEHTLRVGVDDTFEIDGRPVADVAFIGRASGQASLVINGEYGPEMRVMLTSITYGACLAPVGDGVTLSDFSGDVD